MLESVVFLLAVVSLAVLAAGSSAGLQGLQARGPGAFNTFSSAPQRHGPVPQWMDSRSLQFVQSDPWNAYDRGQEALLALGLIPGAGAGLLPSPPAPTLEEANAFLSSAGVDEDAKNILQSSGLDVLGGDVADVSGVSDLSGLSDFSDVSRFSAADRTVSSPSPVFGSDIPSISGSSDFSDFSFSRSVDSPMIGGINDPIVSGLSSARNLDFSTIDDGVRDVPASALESSLVSGQLTGMRTLESGITRVSAAVRKVVREHPMYTLVKRTGYVMRPKKVEVLEKRLVNTPVIEKYMQPIVQKQYKVLPPPVVKKTIRVLPAPIIRNTYKVTPAPVVKKVVNMLPAPIIRKIYKVTPAPVVKKVVNMQPAPIIRKTYQVTPPSVIKKFYQVTPPSVRRINVLPAPIITKVFQIVPAPVVKQYMTPAPIVRQVVMPPRPITKKYFVTPPPVIRKYFVMQQPAVKHLIITPPPIIKNYYNVVKQPTLVEEAKSASPHPVNERVVEVKEETKKMDKSESRVETSEAKRVVTEAPMREVEVEVPDVKTVGKVVLVETVRHVLNVDTFEKQGAVNAAPGRSEETVVDPDGTVRKFEKYVVYDQVPYTKKVLTKVPVSAVEGRQTFLIAKPVEESAQTLSATTPSSVYRSSTPSSLYSATTPSSLLSSSSRLSSLGSPNNLYRVNDLGSPSSLFRVNDLNSLEGRISNAVLANPSLPTEWRSGDLTLTPTAEQLSTASASRSSSSSSSSLSSSSSSRTTSESALERPGDVVSIGGGRLQDASLQNEVDKMQLARYEQSARRQAAQRSAHQSILGTNYNLNPTLRPTFFGPVESMTLSSVTPTSVL